MGECCRQHLIDISHYLVELFDQEKIHYWLHFGSLLGAVREQGRIIPWDSDIDIGVLIERQRLLGLKKRVEDDGYAWSQNHDKLIQIGYSRTNWTYVDLWINEKVARRYHACGKRMTGLELALPIDEWVDSDEPIVRSMAPWQQVNHTGDFPYWFIEKTEQIWFEGRLFNCPRNPKKFIELTYGPNWDTPQEKDLSGYGGNYYPLSHWFDFVNNQMKNHKRDKPLRMSTTPFCRYDTVNCSEIRECCIAHKNELMHATAQLLISSDITHTTDFENFEFVISPEHYDEVNDLAYDQLATYYDIDTPEHKRVINVCFSVHNKNKIKIKFKDG